jgi:hypothetical protein
MLAFCFFKFVGDIVGLSRYLQPILSVKTYMAILNWHMWFRAKAKWSYYTFITSQYRKWDEKR